MHVLVLGGSVFLGRHVVEAALARGWSVTAYSRGINGQPPDGAEHVRGDRADLAPLAGRRWDAVIDTSGRDAAHVEASARLDAGHYVFVSSVSAYAGWPAEPVDEGSPLAPDGPDYAAAKAMGERALAALRPGRAVSVRAGLVVGPHDNVLRLPWWLERLARGGRVVAPGPPDRAMQLVDARDLAAFCLDLAARGDAGAVNATGPVGQTTTRALLTDAAAITGGGARLVWVEPDRLEALGIAPWDELPLWGPWPGTWQAATERAQALGLRCRPLRQTLADTWAWLQAGGREALPGWGAELRPRGLTPLREAEVLAAL